MKAICINCNYIGALLDSEGLVCSKTKEFENVDLNDTCDEFTQSLCESCGSDDLNYYKFTPESKPYIIRTEYNCNSCKEFWYQDI